MKYDHTVKARWNEDFNNIDGYLPGESLDRLLSEVSRLTVKVSELASRFILMATPMKVANTIVARRLLHPQRARGEKEWRAEGEGGRGRVSL